MLEITDFLDTTGKIVKSHDLTWASHTEDKFGRHYRYGSATYFNVDPVTVIPASIVAAVSNTRLAPLGAGNGDVKYPANVLGPASGDAPGGTLIGFSYHWGLSPFAAVLPETVTGIYTSFQVQGGATYQVRNPRYLSVYTPPTPPATGPPFSLLYADDNGAFDLTPTALGFVAGSNNLHFTQTDYQAMTLPVGGISGATYPRSALAFVPSCVQRLNSDATNPRYLITQTNSQSELGSDPTRIGGEVFEVTGNVPSLGTSTLSRPGLTGPLTQPTSAIRPPQ